MEHMLLEGYQKRLIHFSYLQRYFYIDNFTGMQAHGAKYPCGWCFGTAPFTTKAALRTLGDLRRYAAAFNSEDGGRGNLKKAMDYFNCIYEPLLDGPDESLIIDLCPVDELHLMLGELR